MKVKKDGRIRIKGVQEWDIVRMGHAMAPGEVGPKRAYQDRNAPAYGLEIPLLPVTLDAERSRRSVKGILFLAGVKVPQPFDISSVNPDEISQAFELVKRGMEQGVKNWPLGSPVRPGG